MVRTPRKRLFALLLLPLLFAAALLAEERGFAPKVRMEGTALTLNGHGVREKFWIDLYEVALHLPQADNDARRIVEADEPQLLRLVIVSSLISKKKMEKGIREGFQRSTRGRTEGLQERIDRFTEAFGETLEKGDRIDLFYRPGVGVTVYKNGRPVTTLEGKDFKEALWGIWLGEEPVQKSLKNDLLGG